MQSFRSAFLAALFLGIAALSAAPAGRAQAQTSTVDVPVSVRDATRERLRDLLATAGPRINVVFTQSTKEPYNFIGILSQDLKNCDSLEIVISVTKSNTIGFRIYPHYKNGYINLGRVQDPAAFSRQLLRFSDTNFLFWGSDDAADTFAGYTITLESGFPDASIKTVLSSIQNTDIFVGKLRPAIDGGQAK